MLGNPQPEHWICATVLRCPGDRECRFVTGSRINATTINIGGDLVELELLAREGVGAPRSHAEVGMRALGVLLAGGTRDAGDSRTGRSPAGRPMSRSGRSRTDSPCWLGDLDAMLGLAHRVEVLATLLRVVAPGLC